MERLLRHSNLVNHYVNNFQNELWRFAALSLQATLLNPDNTPANLTGASVVFVMSQRSTLLFSGSAVVVDAVNGVVQYNWLPGNTNYYGSCKGSFAVTYPSGLTQTFPVGADLNMVFPQNYPEFTSLDEVIDHLNASGPDSKNNFTVYGLLVSADSVQAQVDHANKYLSSLVPGLVLVSDSRWPSADLAALNIACLGVLVTSVGGSMVGAYDYFLGDMRVARAGPYATAIKAAIAGYRESALTNLQNVASVATGKTAAAADHVPRWRGWVGALMSSELPSDTFPEKISALLQACWDTEATGLQLTDIFWSHDKYETMMSVEDVTQKAVISTYNPQNPVSIEALSPQN